MIADICVLSAGLLALGYALLAANRTATPPRIDIARETN
jgi:hypothetical protein